MSVLPIAHCLWTFPISLRDPDTMEVLGYTTTETLLWDYSEVEEYHVLVRPPARRVRTLYVVPWWYAYHWFHLFGGTDLRIVYYPFKNVRFGDVPEPTCDAEIIEIFASITVSPSSVGENGGIDLIFTITLDSASAFDTEITYSVSGTATQGDDYTASFINPIIILAGQTTGTITVTPVDDAFDEDDETVIVTLLSGTSGTNIVTISPTGDSATGTIVSEDIVIPTVTWDPPTAINVTLSNGNLTATNDFAAGVQGITATVSHTTGKFYFEITCTSVTATSFNTYNWGVGQFFALSNTYSLYSATHFGGAGGDQPGRLLSNSGGTIYGLNLGVNGLRSGDVIGVAVDLTARGFWAKLVAGPGFPNSGSWNGNSSAPASDPATGSKPVVVPAGDMFPIFTFNDDALTQSATFNFGGSAFVGTLPSGYSAWSAVATLDPATAYKVILSNGNLTVTNESEMEPEQIVSIPLIYAKSSGKYYYEITLQLDSENNGNSAATFGLTTATYTGLVDDGLDGIIVFESGNIFANEIFEGPRIPGGGSLGGSDTGDVIGIAVDFDHGNVWFNVVDGPNAGIFTWNGVNIGDPSQDPSTNTGGVFLRAGTAFMPFAIFTGDAANGVDSETANFGASAFLGPVPTGFTAGWPISGGNTPPSINTWDATTAIGCTTSNGDLTISNQGAVGVVQGVKALVRKTLGKFYFEITLNNVNLASTNLSFGVAQTMTAYSEIIGVYDMSQVFVFLGGAIRQNGGSSGRSIGQLHSGDVIGIAVELRDNFDAWVWFKVVAGPDVAGANWNGIVGGTPSSVFDGVYLDGNTVLPFVIFDSTDATEQMTANFGATAFSGTVPSGFTAGWPA